jgi:2-methylcitrate dehydratase PrpD
MLLIGEPAEKKANPSNIVEAQFSGPFVIASALITGKMAWDSYLRLNDPEIRALMQRIVCENDPEIEAYFPANMSGKLNVKAGGRTFTRTVVVPKGEPQNFLTESELRAKFFGLADAVLDAAHTAQLASNVLTLDKLKYATALFE